MLFCDKELIVTENARGGRIRQPRALSRGSGGCQRHKFGVSCPGTPGFAQATAVTWHPEKVTQARFPDDKGDRTWSQHPCPVVGVLSPGSPLRCCCSHFCCQTSGLPAFDCREAKLHSHWLTVSLLISTFPRFRIGPLRFEQGPLTLTPLPPVCPREGGKAVWAAVAASPKIRTRNKKAEGPGTRCLSDGGDLVGSNETQSFLCVGGWVWWFPNTRISTHRPFPVGYTCLFIKKSKATTSATCCARLKPVSERAPGREALPWLGDPSALQRRRGPGPPARAALPCSCPAGSPAAGPAQRPRVGASVSQERRPQHEPRAVRTDPRGASLRERGQMSQQPPPLDGPGAPGTVF